MHTNGGCRCFKQNDGIKAQRVIRAYKEEVERLRGALKRLSFAAQTTGGVAGRDEGLVAAIDNARQALGDRP
jgi:hypothetical protein